MRSTVAISTAVDILIAEISSVRYLLILCQAVTY